MSELKKDFLEIELSKLTDRCQRISIDKQETLDECLKLMKDHRCGCLCVSDEQKLVGVISEKDILFTKAQYLENCSETKAFQVMTSPILSLESTSNLSEAIKFMAKKNLRNLPIVDGDGKLCFLLNLKDIITFIAEHFPEQVQSIGTLTSWELVEADQYSESFSFSPASEDHFSGNIFMTPLKRVTRKRPILLDKSATIGELVEAIKGRKVNSALLMSYETKIEGIITERDLIYKVFNNKDICFEDSALTIMTANPHTLLSRHYLSHAINNMNHFKYRNIIIVNEENYPVSIISMHEIFKFVAYKLYQNDALILEI